MKKTISVLLFAAVALSSLAGCGSSASTPAPSGAPASNFKADTDITVVSREDGSGTRGAFIELMGIEEKGSDGSKTDRTTKEAVIANKTDVMLQNISGDPYAIGYVSLGSLNDTVKAVKVDGVEATSENVKNGSYAVARPFFIAVKDQSNPVAQDLIAFILSKEGQEVVAKSYIAVDDAAPAFRSAKPVGRCVIAGSSSVSPIMEKLVESYQAVNPGADIEIQTSDSTAGMTNAVEGTCDIGMASRGLKESELASLTPIQIAIDGIAVIVNNANPAGELTSAQIKAVFTGGATVWSDAVK